MIEPTVTAAILGVLYVLGLLAELRSRPRRRVTRCVGRKCARCSR